MADGIADTSPLVYLYRVGALAWMPRLLDTIWVPTAVVEELKEGLRRGYDVPNPAVYPWLEIVDPRQRPVEWFALDLGAGELSAMALALENPSRVVLLDDALARRTAQAAGLAVWGTLKLLLEAKSRGLVSSIAPLVESLSKAGLWLTPELHRRVLDLAGEA